MNSQNMCRCCLSQGTHKDINAIHVWLNQKEIYSEMLFECFSIILSKTDSISCICDVCVKMLRDSLDFKQQVLRSEHEFLKRCTGLQEEQVTQVKIEVKNESSDDSDDYLLADAACNTPTEPQKVKTETTLRPPARRKGRVANELINGERTSLPINPNEFPELTISKSSSQRSKKAGGMTRSSKVAAASKVTASSKVIVASKVKIASNASKVSWVGRASHEKAKHQHNLYTILTCSNATPFKNKSLLGYTCAYCGVPHPDPAALRAHTRTHSAPSPASTPASTPHLPLSEYVTKLDVADLKCTLCHAPQDNLTTLKSHLTMKHEKIFHNDVKDLILQFKLKTGEVYDCCMCSSTYETFKMLKQHMNKHYSNYSCEECGSSFATRRSLNSHAKTHVRGNFKCGHCEKVFASKPKRQYHEKMKHMGARNISNCPFCNEPFRSYYRRNQHLIKVHNSEAKYKCNVCAKAYILKSLLMSHIKKNHLMERNCQCTECGFRFFSKKALKAHMVKHTGERTYACAVCHKAYARKYTLREHMRIHEDDRRFRCTHCAHAFVQKCSLRSHLLSTHGVSVAAGDITETGRL